MQRPDGHIEDWYGEGNFNRTLLLYAYMKSQGVRPEHWEPGIGVGAVREGERLRLVLDMPQSMDYYEALQISPNADAELIRRVFRLLARRYHPDNQRTGNATLFRQLHEAYTVLSDAERRAQYDAIYEGQKQQRWRLLEGAMALRLPLEAKPLI